MPMTESLQNLVTETVNLERSLDEARIDSILTLSIRAITAMADGAKTARKALLLIDELHSIEARCCGNYHRGVGR